MTDRPSMRALQMRGVGDLILTDLPLPEPGLDDVLIRTQVATVCTSDLHDVDSNPFGIALPRVLGHEAEGRIVACGRRVHGWLPGTRVAVHPVVPCGTCPECERGLGHLCRNMGHLGYDRDGAFAEYFVQRADRIRSLPESAPPGLGALLEPVAVCLQAIARAGPLAGRDVLIAGDGPFGNLIARLVRRSLPARVIVVGRGPFRLGRIPNVETVCAAPRSSVDVAILAVSSVEAAADCLGALRPRGRLVIFSALPKEVPLDLLSIHLRELEVVGSCNDEERLDTAMDCLNEPALGLHEVITHRLPFAEWKSALDLARNGHHCALKVALTFPPAP